MATRGSVPGARPVRSRAAVAGRTGRGPRRIPPRLIRRPVGRVRPLERHLFGFQGRVGAEIDVRERRGEHHRVHQLTHGVQLDEHVLDVPLEPHVIAGVQLLVDENDLAGE